MKKFLLIVLSATSISLLKAQNVGIGTTTPNSSALVDISSTTKGVLVPRMTSSQRVSIASPVTGLMVYDTDKNEFYHFNGTGWRVMLNSDYWIRPITTRDRISNIADSVGIGISSPAERLDVIGNIRTRNNLLVDNNIVASGNLLVADMFGTNLHIVGGVVQIEDQTIGKTLTTSLEFSSHIVPIIDDSRSLGLSTRRFSAVWATDGTINTSDARDKSKITDINYGLSEILKLRPVSFQWKNKPQSETKLGLIAQEVEAVLPEVVANPKRNPALFTEDKGSAAVRLGMYYSDIIPVLIKAVQELSKQNEDLKARFEKLESIILKK